MFSNLFEGRHEDLTKAPYIRHECYDNLFVLPYVNYRLVFSGLAVEAISKGGFDIVAVDLPSFFNGNKWLDTIIKSFPFLASMIVKISDNEIGSFNFVPNDAASISAYLINKLRKTGSCIEMECIDDVNIVNYAKKYFYPPKLALMDDYFAFTDGVEDYFSTPYKEMDKIWPSFSSEQKFLWDYRANTVADRLYKLLKTDRQTLFICNYLLWWLVNKKLTSGDFKKKDLPFWPAKEHVAALVFQNPSFLWIKGALDDYPALVLRFFNKLEKAQFVSFNKLKILNEIIQACVMETEKTDKRHLSIRKIQAFKKYLLVRLAVNRKRTPALTTYLYDAAISCMGSYFANNLAERLLEYPEPINFASLFFTINHQGIAQANTPFEFGDGLEHLFLNSFSPFFQNSSDNLNDTEEKRMKLVSMLYPFLKKDELRYLKGDIGTEWALKKEYSFHSQVTRSIREMVQKKSQEVRILRSFGSVGEGIDWKTTIYSRATKENAIYIRKLKRDGMETTDLNPFTPMVFIFDQTMDQSFSRSIYDSNVTQRIIDLGNEKILKSVTPPPDFVYSVFYTTVDSEYICKDHIRKVLISAVLFLFSSHWMGIERYQRITTKPNRFQCRLTPDQDRELEIFHYPDKLVACGIKYAEKAVIVVSGGDWKPSIDILTYARRKAVQIYQVPISSLSPKVVQKMKYIHFTSTPLKKHPDHEAIVDRFVPDIFE